MDFIFEYKIIEHKTRFVVKKNFISKFQGKL